MTFAQAQQQMGDLVVVGHRLVAVETLDGGVGFLHLRTRRVEGGPIVTQEVLIIGGDCADGLLQDLGELCLWIHQRTRGKQPENPC